MTNGYCEMKDIKIFKRKTCKGFVSGNIINIKNTCFYVVVQYNNSLTKCVLPEKSLKFGFFSNNFLIGILSPRLNFLRLKAK
jgi:hypothetical protein